MYKTPNYVPVEIIRSWPDGFVWDDWDPYLPIGDVSDETIEALSCLSDRAVIAYAIACTDWIVARLSALDSDPRPKQYLEAFWFFEMSAGIFAPPESDEDDWQGRDCQVADLANMTVLNAIRQTEIEVPAVDAAFSEKLAFHVLGRNEPFAEWRSSVLRRLQQEFPRDEHSPWGEPIPREALDPSYPFSVNEAPILVRRFQSSVDVARNPLIRRVP